MVIVTLRAKTIEDQGRIYQLWSSISTGQPAQVAQDALVKNAQGTVWQNAQTGTTTGSHLISPGEKIGVVLPTNNVLDYHTIRNDTQQMRVGKTAGATGLMRFELYRADTKALIKLSDKADVDVSTLNDLTTAGNTETSAFVSTGINNPQTGGVILVMHFLAGGTGTIGVPLKTTVAGTLNDGRVISQSTGGAWVTHLMEQPNFRVNFGSAFSIRYMISASSMYYTLSKPFTTSTSSGSQNRMYQRFQGITIPIGATITSAVLTFRTGKSVLASFIGSVKAVDDKSFSLPNPDYTRGSTGAATGSPTSVRDELILRIPVPFYNQPSNATWATSADGAYEGQNLPVNGKVVRTTIPLCRQAGAVGDVRGVILKDLVAGQPGQTVVVVSDNTVPLSSLPVSPTTKDVTFTFTSAPVLNETVFVGVQLINATIGFFEGRRNDPGTGAGNWWNKTSGNWSDASGFGDFTSKIYYETSPVPFLKKTATPTLDSTKTFTQSLQTTTGNEFGAHEKVIDLTTMVQNLVNKFDYNNDSMFFQLGVKPGANGSTGSSVNARLRVYQLANSIQNKLTNVPSNGPAQNKLGGETTATSQGVSTYVPKLVIDFVVAVVTDEIEFDADAVLTIDSFLRSCIEVDGILSVGGGPPIDDFEVALAILANLTANGDQTGFQLLDTTINPVTGQPYNNGIIKNSIGYLNRTNQITGNPYFPSEGAYNFKKTTWTVV